MFARFFLLLPFLLVCTGSLLPAQQRNSLDDDLRYYAERANQRADQLKAQRERYAAYADKPGDPFAAKYAALSRQIEAAEKSAAKYQEYVGIDTGTMAVIKDAARMTHDDLVEMNQLLMKNWALWMEDALTGNWTNLVKTAYDTMFRQKVRKQIREALGVADSVAPLEAYLMDLALGVATKDNATIATEWFCKKAGLSPADLKKSPQELVDIIALRQINLDPATIETLAKLSVSPENHQVDWVKVREMAVEKATAKGLETLKDKYANEAKRQFQDRMQQELGKLAYASDSLAEQVRDRALNKVTDAIDSANFVTDIAQKIYEWSQADFDPVFDGVKQYRTLLQKATGKTATWEEAFVAWQARSKFNGTTPAKTADVAAVENTKPILVSTHVVSSSLEKGRVTMRLETTWRALAFDPQGYGGFLTLTRDDVTLAERIPQAAIKSSKTVQHPYTMLNDPRTGRQAATEYEVITVHTFTDQLKDFQQEPVPLRSWDYEFIWEAINDMGATVRIGQAPFTPRFSISLVAHNSAQAIALNERELTEAERGATVAKVGDTLKAGPVEPIPWIPPANAVIIRHSNQDSLYLRNAKGEDVFIGARRYDESGELIYQKIEIDGRIQGLLLGSGYEWYHNGVRHGPFEKHDQKGAYRNGKLHGPWEDFQGMPLTLHETRTYIDGELDGENITYLSDGVTPSAVLLYDHGALLPPQRFFDNEGELKEEYCFDSRIPAAPGAGRAAVPFRAPSTGSLDGIVRKFRKGVLIAEIPYRAGIKHGIETKGPPESRQEISYRDGVKHGTVRAYKRGLLDKEEIYEDGELTVRRSFRDFKGESRIFSEDLYRNNQRHGTCRGFDLASGAASYEHEYVDGELIRARDNKTFTEYKDGKPTLITTYYELGGQVRQVKKFRPDGTWDETRYYENGVLSEESHRGALPYRGGILEASVGRCVGYYPDGTKKRDSQYGADGKLDGMNIRYGPGGIKQEETEYRDRLKVGVSRTFHANGKLKTDATYVEGRRQGRYREYFEDGSVQLERYFRDDQLHGMERRYSAPDVLAEETEYAAGQKHGIYRRFYPDGNKQIECTYADDRYEGPYLSWYKDGRLKWEFNYVAGKKHGRCVEHKETGFILWSRSGLYEQGERVAPLPEAP